jgi:hypothetical protein
VGDDYVSIEEAARLSGLHINSIRRLLRKGSLYGYKATEGKSRRWMISIQSLRRYTDPQTGFLLELPGPKLYLTRRDEKKGKQGPDD